MAKETILLEYQLVQKGGDKVVSTVTDITEAWEKSEKAATAALSEKQIDSATAKLEKFNVEVEKTATQFTSAKGELNALTKQITSGQLQGKDLQVAVKRAAELKDRLGDVRSEIGKLSSDTRIFDTFVEGGRAVAAAFSVAQGATALFGEENKDLQKAILKTQGALALLTGAQELANIVTTKGGIATQAYGVAIKVVEGIQKAFAISAAASWAVATAGLTLLVAGVASLVYWYNQTDDATEEVTQSTNEFADSLRGTTREAANLRIELEKSKGNISDTSAQLQKNNQARLAAIEDANIKEKEAIDNINAEIAKADGESLQKLLDQRNKIRSDAEANRKGINQKFFLQDELLLQESENRKAEIEKKAAEERAKLRKQNKEIENVGKFEVEVKPLVRDDIFIESVNKQVEDVIEKVPDVEIPVEVKPLISELKITDFLGTMTEAVSVISSLANSAIESQIDELKNNLNEQSILLDAQKERELKSAGDNVKKREAIEKKFAKQKQKLDRDAAIEEAKLRREQAIVNKALAVVNIAINTASAISKAIEAAPLTGGLPFSAIAAALGAAQAIAVAATPLPPVPKFAEGVIGFKGKGTQTSDENLVMISNNESILKGSATQKYGEELTAANNLELEDLIYHKYLLPALKQAGAADKEGNLYDDWMLRREVKASRQADRENSKYIVDGILRGIGERNYISKRHYS